MTIPGGDFLTTGLNLISQSLLIPVVIILLVFVVVVVISLEGLSMNTLQGQRYL